MSLNRFGYKTLNEDLREFRLLALHPRASHDEYIYISITTHKLAAPPPYEALSYVWGAFIRDDPYYILIGEEEGLEVSPNLFRILYKLSLHGKERVMWIDAICIDQNDLDERSSQVQLMRDIYEQATRTIVFLGEETVGTRGMLPILEEMTWDQRWGIDEEITTPFSIESKANFKQRLATTSRAEGSLSAGFYDDIAARPFWTRIWIVQEVVLSKNPAIMLGDQEITWDWFADRSSILDSIVQEIFPEISTDSSGLSNLNVIQNIRRLHKLGFQPSICDLLASLRGTKSTDPRDMVYGLLGLIKTSIIVDYDASTTQTVYVDVVKHSILEDRSLDVITMRRAPSPLSGLPSWAPDWSSNICDFSQEGDFKDGTNRMPEPLVLRYMDGDLMRECLTLGITPTKSIEGNIVNIKPFNASAGRTLSINEAVIDKQTMVLQASGLLVGTISDIGMVLDREEARGEIFFHDAFRDWEKVFRCQYGNGQIELNKLVVTVTDALTRIYSLLTTYLTEIEVDYSPEAWKLEQFQKNKTKKTERGRSMTRDLAEPSPVEAFVRTILADGNLKFQRISPSHFEEFWADPLPNESTWPREVYSMTSATHRRFFVTCNGSMGLAPMRARKNDIVCVLYGCSIPIVLREEEKGRFSFIGECFLHGFMDGEAIDIMKTGDLEELKWTIY